MPAAVRESNMKSWFMDGNAARKSKSIMAPRLLVIEIVCAAVSMSTRFNNIDLPRINPRCTSAIRCATQ
eukprot:3134964-Karenia_brevis.AAC.1